MRLYTLPRDAMDNVLSRLRMPDVLSLACSSPRLCLAVAPYLRAARVQLHPSCAALLLSAPQRMRVGLHVRHLVLRPPLALHLLPALAAACPRLDALSLHDLSVPLPPALLANFLRPLGPALRAFSAHFCHALSGPLLLTALADHCSNLEQLRLRFAPRVYAEHLDLLLARVGPRMRVLDLDTCIGIDDDLVKAVAYRCPSLCYLCVGGAEDVGDDAILALSAAPCASKLLHLDIRGCMHVTDHSIFAVATSCTALTHLNVWRVCLTSYAIRAIAEGLGEHLETLIMGDCIGIDDTAVVSIADNCDALVNLEMVGLKRVTDTGIMALFDGKKLGRARLDTLTVDGCRSITEKGILAALGLLDLPHVQGDTKVEQERGETGAFLRGNSLDGTACSDYDVRDGVLKDVSEGYRTDMDDDHGSEYREDYKEYYSSGIEGDNDQSDCEDRDDETCFSLDGEDSVQSGDTLSSTASSRECRWKSFDDDEDRCTEGYDDSEQGSYVREEEAGGVMPMLNVSYLRRLSASGTEKMGLQTWRHVHEMRSWVEVRVEVRTEEEEKGVSKGGRRAPRVWRIRCKDEELDSGCATAPATGIDTRSVRCVKYRDAAGLALGQS